MLLERLSSFNIIDFLVIAFATYRVSVMLTHEWEVGPKRVLSRLREKAGWITPSFGGVAYAEEGSLADGLMCYFCNSIWVGTFITVIYAILMAFNIPAWIIFMPCAASGAAVLIAEVTEDE